MPVDTIQSWQRGLLRTRRCWPSRTGGRSGSGDEEATSVSDLDTVMRPGTHGKSVTAKVDPGLERLFGGRTRVRILAVLANAAEPVTAYRIARVAGSQVGKTSVELRRLERSGIVRRVAPSSRGLGWVMVDPDLRRLLQRRVRLVWVEDWDRLTARQALLARRSHRPRIDLARFRPSPGSVPNRSEFLRSTAKDRILAEMGLPTSRHAARKS